MALALGALLVLPLVLGAAQRAAPASLSALVGALLTATPGVAVMQAVSVTPLESGEFPHALTGMGVLLAWVVATGLGAQVQFQREGSRA